MSILDGGFSAPAQPSRSRPHGNVRALKIAVFVAFGVLTIQLINMQVVQGANYRQRSEENHLRVTSILPPRGLIFDRNGQQLVQNIGVFQASVTPELLPKKRDERYRIYLALAKLTGVPELEIQSRVDDAEAVARGYIAITIQKYLSKEQALQLQELTSDMPGVALVVTPGRRYLEGETLAHILGYVAAQDPEDAAFYRAQGYRLNEFVGKSGIESKYEEDLRGEPGLSSNEEDAYGNVISRLKTTDAKPGDSLQLAIDLPLQNFVYDLLQAHMEEADVAAAVVMNAKTGEIYALVSYPGYDNNLFTEPEKRDAEFATLSKDPRKPFLNWALSASTPGSTFKLLTAAAALQEGNITPQTGRNVTSLVLEIKGVNGQIYPLYDWNVHGYVNLYTAIAKSSNIYFYQASCGVPQENIKGLGNITDDTKSAVLLADYAHDFGFGQSTGIDIAGESNGIIPTPEWKRQAHSGPSFYPEDRLWYFADTCFMGIGQGDVTATPLQIARMTATIANGGTLVTPHIAKAVLDAQGKVVREITPKTSTVPVDPQHLKDIREGMYQSVNLIDGAGVAARQAGSGVAIAGKTGTAEFGPVLAATGKQDQHAWFTGFAPYGDPTFVVTVYFDRGIGGAKAAPVAGAILKYAVENVTP